MHTIERYGVVVLTLVAVSIGAVFLFEGEPLDNGGAAARQAAAEAQQRIDATGSGNVLAASGSRSASSPQVGRPNGNHVGGRLSAAVLRGTKDVATQAGGVYETASQRLARIQENNARRQQAGRSSSPQQGSQGSQGSASWAGVGNQLLQQKAAKPSGEKVNLSLNTPAPQAGRQSRRRSSSKPRANQTKPAKTPAKAVAAVERSGSAGIYVVRAGDTLGHISQRELGTFKRWQEIVKLNPEVDPSRIVAGMELRMPAGSAPKASKSKSSKAGKLRTNQIRVADGESLWTIAERLLGDGTRFTEIAKLNPSINPDRLKTGQVLTVPVGAAALPRKKSPKKAAQNNAIAKHTPRKKSRKVL